MTDIYPSFAGIYIPFKNLTGLQKDFKSTEYTPIQITNNSKNPPGTHPGKKSWGRDEAIRAYASSCGKITRSHGLLHLRAVALHSPSASQDVGMH